MEATSSYAGEIRAAFRGFPTTRFLKSTLSELMFGNGNVGISPRIRNDNSSVVEHVHSINAVTKERRSNAFQGNNRELETDPWLALSRIVGPLDIFDWVENQRPELS